MPWFVEFETMFGDEGFAVLGVSVDDTGRDIVEPFLERSPVNYRIALADTVERDSPPSVRRTCSPRPGSSTGRAGSRPSTSVW